MHPTPPLPGFPENRMRRLRQNETLREMIAETSLSKSDLIMPVFVRFGKNTEVPISSMPGIKQMTIDKLVPYCETLYNKGVKSVLLFGIPEEKDETGDVACQHNGIIQDATRALKEKLPNILIVADVCNCEYTTHGHCGTIVAGDVDNDLTLATLAKQAVSLAEAGVDIIAPSDMMDGRISAIRKALDKAGFYKMPIMAYSAKFASAYYGPFRDAAESAPQFGDRRTYQMDYRNSNEALREIQLDIQEGADMIMVKPGIAYLDIIARARDTFQMPTVAYNVSGEFSMIKAAAQNGWIDEERTIIETMYAFKRAGADLIITYHAEQLADLI